MHYKNFVKYLKGIGEKMFTKYLSGCFVKTVILLTVMITTMLGTEDETLYSPDRNELLCKLSRPCRNSPCFQKMMQLFNLMRIMLLGEK